MASAAGADVLLRVGWRSYGWRDQIGAAASLTARFDHVGPGLDRAVTRQVTGPDGTIPPFRVIAFGQSDAAMCAARRKIRRNHPALIL